METAGFGLRFSVSYENLVNTFSAVFDHSLGVTTEIIDITYEQPPR